MLLIYNIAVSIYRLAIRLASVFNPKARKWTIGRKGLLEKIEQQAGGYSGKTVWVHCASLGEFEMARPIMENLKKSEPDCRLILTFFSPSGFEVRKQYSYADHVFYLPIDSKNHAKRFIEAVAPTTVIFVKYDLWFHYLSTAKLHGAHIILISAQFSKEHWVFKWYGAMAKRTLLLFDRIFTVDKESEELLNTVGIKNITVCGDTRYDRVMDATERSEPVEHIETFKGSSRLIVCGSTWPEDETVLGPSVDELPEVKWIIAPHEISERDLARLQSRFVGAVRYSELKDGQDCRVVLIDSIGLLSRLYRYADAAYVGGGFRTGLHNVLESTAFGVPTLFGPDHARFPDAGTMARTGLAFSIRNKRELKDRLVELLRQDDQELRDNTINFMAGRTGATSAILQHLNSLPDR